MKLRVECVVRNIKEQFFKQFVFPLFPLTVFHYQIFKYKNLIEKTNFYHSYCRIKQLVIL